MLLFQTGWFLGSWPFCLKLHEKHSFSPSLGPWAVHLTWHHSQVCVSLAKNMGHRVWSGWVEGCLEMGRTDGALHVWCAWCSSCGESESTQDQVRLSQFKHRRCQLVPLYIVWHVCHSVTEIYMLWQLPLSCKSVYLNFLHQQNSTECCFTTTPVSYFNVFLNCSLVHILIYTVVTELTFKQTTKQVFRAAVALRQSGWSSNGKICSLILGSSRRSVEGEFWHVV